MTVEAMDTPQYFSYPSEWLVRATSSPLPIHAHYPFVCQLVPHPALLTLWNGGRDFLKPQPSDQDTAQQSLRESRLQYVHP